VGKLTDYGLPIVGALVLHAVVVAMLEWEWVPSFREPVVLQPKAIKAMLVVREPRRSATKKKPLSAKTNGKLTSTPQKTPPLRNRAFGDQDAASSKVKETGEQRMERERRERMKARRQQLQEMRRRDFERSLAQDAIDISVRADQEVAQSYVDGIYASIVAHWSRPPSARNEMAAGILVELFPTGDLNTVSLLDSSGSAPFDRSALAAVRKARRFEVPQDSEVFEAQFRTFRLLFKPEDLLR
jgi:colicin import membrane protein